MKRFSLLLIVFLILSAFLFSSCGAKNDADSDNSQFDEGAVDDQNNVVATYKVYTSSDVALQQTADEILAKLESMNALPDEIKTTSPISKFLRTFL